MRVFWISEQWSRWYVSQIQDTNENIGKLVTLKMLVLGFKRIKPIYLVLMFPFIHRPIHRIIKIKMSEVRDRKINNERLRDMFYHTPNIRELIAIR